MKLRRPGVLPAQDHCRQFLASLPADARLLNAGCSVTSFPGSVDIDISRARGGLDAQADVHALPFRDNSFDAIVCTAVLQYCERPDLVEAEFRRVLRPGGRLLINVPFLQPFCPDGPDLIRYTRPGLLRLFRRWQIEVCAPAIRATAAIGFHVHTLVSELPLPKRAHQAAVLAAQAIVQPLKWWNAGNGHETAGAFYLVARNR